MHSAFPGSLLRVISQQQGFSWRVCMNIAGCLASYTSLDTRSTRACTQLPSPPAAYQLTCRIHQRANLSQTHNSCKTWHKCWRHRIHTSAPCWDMGVVSQLSLSQLAHRHESQLLAHTHTVEVVEFMRDGTVHEKELVLESLPLHPKDMLLFINGMYSPHRAIIAVRDGMILFKTELTRAIILPAKAFVFPSRRKRDTVEVAQSIFSNIASISVTSAPFEFKVLDALLAESVRYFDIKQRRLAVVAGSVSESITGSLNSRNPQTVGELQRLIPVQNKLAEMREDVTETLDSINGILESEEILASACLSDRGLQQRIWKFTTQDTFTVPMQKLAGMLERYEYQMRAVQGALQEVQERLDGARIVWQMQLDSLRNRIIRINLFISLCSFSLMVATVPSTWLGMNVANGWEDAGHMFPKVIASSVAAAGLAFCGAAGYFLFWPNRQFKNKARDVQVLQDLLLYHMDDLDDILVALKERHGVITKTEFITLARKAQTSRIMTPDEVDLLWRVFDANRAAFLQLADLIRHQTKRVEQFDYPADDTQ